MWSLQQLLASNTLATLFWVLNAAGTQPDPSLVVKTTTGTFRGAAAPGSVDRWLGIPFAQRPLGNLRFVAPQPITNPTSNIVNTTQFGPACPQPPKAGIGPILEDCLYLNIWRPQNVSLNRRLPVLFWIHGGAWTTGSASDPASDPTEIIQRSVEIQKPIIFVSTNYRLNTFGFLASGTMDPKNLNAGLLDQIAALNFVQDNIAAFGGDPSKVTIWGQSAGGGSVQAHFIYPTDRPLFRAGIADSSVGPFKNSPPPDVYDKPGKSFTRLLATTGCDAGPEAVACLQRVPFETLLNISNSMIAATLNRQLWEPTVLPGTIINVEASQRIISGNFLHLPYLGGTNLNEGTFFSPTLRNLGLTGASQDQAFDSFVGALVIDNTTITPDVYAEFRRLYPANDSHEGAPFNTGDSLFDRGAAWYTDMFFLGPRRFWFNHASATQAMFAYHFREFIPGNDPSLGVTHISELPMIFGPLPSIAQIETGLSNQMRDFWINFVNDLNPGGDWEPYKPNDRRVLQLLRDNVTMIPDDFDVVNTNFINSARVREEFQK